MATVMPQSSWPFFQEPPQPADSKYVLTKNRRVMVFLASHELKGSCAREEGR